MFLFKLLIYMGFASVYTVISLRFRNYYFGFSKPCNTLFFYSSSTTDWNY